MSRFELTITVLNEQDVQARTLGGGEGSGKVKLESLQRQTIGIFEDWLSRGKISQRRELEVLGTYLYEALFNGDVEKLFLECLNDVQEAKKAGNDEVRLIIRLSFKNEAANLKDLPWEYLYFPETETHAGFFLSTDVVLVLSHYIPPERSSQEPEPEKSPLRVLIVVSNPEDNTLGPVVSGEVIETIQQLAEKYPMKIDTLDKPTTEHFLEKLDETKPHVLHFIGHGHYRNAERRAEIALLQDDERSVRWVGDSEFAEYFGRISTPPRLILLHLCESATVINYDTFTANFASLAPVLMRANIPAVLAMQHPITNQAAKVFSKYFYLALVKGKTIDTAVQDGRWRITLLVPNSYNNRVFGTPVLYARSYGGIIRPVEETASTQAIPEETARKPQKAPPMAGDGSTNPFVKLTPNVPMEPIATAPAKQDTGGLVESRQAVPGGSLEARKTDLNEFYRSNFVQTIILAGQSKMDQMPDLTDEQKTQLSQKLSTIYGQLSAVEKPDDMMEILWRNKLESKDSNPRVIIQSMIEFLEKRKGYG